ncbi:ABC transporter permease [Paenibacillaceae bacterium WGS1546]|uniref:ABC transporter permease n=1 Tax=Cohnella sp. WGS1546 TaxID=3366810 RepID=UPI00372D6351
MNGFGALLLKEWRETVRTGKIVWLPAVFLLLGLAQPIAMKLMPEILSSAGNLPEGTIIRIPVPMPEEVMAQTLGQFGTVGLLAICLAYMGTISSERRNGTSAWILVKPVSPYAYVASKWLVHAAMVFFSFALGYGGAWYYTAALFGDPGAGGTIASGLLYGGWLLFVGTLTITASAWLQSPAAAAFSALSIGMLMQLLQGLYADRLDWLPSGLNAAASSRLAGEGAPWVAAAAVAATCAAALLGSAVRRLRGPKA